MARRRKRVTLPETALVQRLRARLDQSEGRETVTIDRRDVQRVLARLLYGCGERNEPVRHPMSVPRCRYCGKPESTRNFAYHVCVGR